MSSFYWMNRGMVGKLQVKSTNHWRSIDDEYWTSKGIRIFTGNWYDERQWWRTKVSKSNILNSMVKLQHKLVDAAKCNDHDMILSGGIQQWCLDDDFNYKTPFHPDLLPNYGKKYISIISICFYPFLPLLI